MNSNDYESGIAANLQPYFRGRLTRKILMTLPEGVFLQSNVCDTPLIPQFEGHLGPLETRESTWKQMKERGVDGRLFNGYATEESYDHDFMMKINALQRQPSVLDRKVDFSGEEYYH